MKNHTPIKRHPALVSLSRDHHFGLLLVWKIRQGLRTAVNARQISSYVLFFFEADLQRHFNEEENDLFNKLPEDDTLKNQALAEHQKIYELIDAIKQNPEDSSLLNEFAGALESHIRFEERQLFNHLQKTLSPAALEKAELHKKQENLNPDDKWDDRFWEKNKP